jgi:hypothetical protein
MVAGLEAWDVELWGCVRDSRHALSQSVSQSVLDGEHNCAIQEQEDG